MSYDFTKNRSGNNRPEGPRGVTAALYNKLREFYPEFANKNYNIFQLNSGYANPWLADKYPEGSGYDLNKVGELHE